MSDLMPCPFCGGDKIETHYVRDGRRVVCMKCHAESPPAFHGKAADPSADERAIAAWNTRAPSANPAWVMVPVAWRYRWKLDGEWTSWRVAGHSQRSRHLRDLEEQPLYAAAPTSDAAQKVGEIYAEADEAMKAYENWLDETGLVGSDDLRDAFLWGRASAADGTYKADAAPSATDLETWVRSLPVEVTPKLREAYEFYLKHHGADAAQKVGK